MFLVQYGHNCYPFVVGAEILERNDCSHCLPEERVEGVVEVGVEEPYVHLHHYWKIPWDTAASPYLLYSYKDFLFDFVESLVAHKLNAECLEMMQTIGMNPQSHNHMHP